jgi:hypothetical protein
MGRFLLEAPWDYGFWGVLWCVSDGGWRLRDRETEILKIPEAGKRDFFHLSLLANVSQKIPVTICSRSGEAYGHAIEHRREQH